MKIEEEKMAQWTSMLERKINKVVEQGNHMRHELEKEIHNTLILKTIIEEVFKQVPKVKEMKDASLDQRMGKFRKTIQGLQGKVEELS